MLIKTIKKYIDYSDLFDREVNEALSDGWILKKRYISDGGPLTEREYAKRMLIAELVKDEDPILRPLKIDVSVDLEEAKRQLEEFKEEIISETIQIKYFDPDLEQIEKINVGDWIDLRAAERVELRKGDYYLIRLGVGMILPAGYEALILPRSSTPSKFGIMLANSCGVIDNSYSGDADEWKFPAVAIRDTVIEEGDRIAQFRILENQPRITFETVPHLKNKSRGGIGSTGRR